MYTLFPGPVDRLDQMLLDLDAVCADLRSDELQYLTKQSKKFVAKLRNVLKRSQVEQVADLVQAKEFSQATTALKNHFPLNPQGAIEEVLVYTGDELDGLESTIKWVGQLDVQLRPRAYEAIYEQFKSKRFTDQPQVLLLWTRIRFMPVGFLDTVRTQLDADRSRLIERIVEGVQKKDYSLSLSIHQVDESFRRDIFLNDAMAAVVSKFENLDVDNVLLLIEFSVALPRVENCCYLIWALWKALAALNLQDSEQALHLYAHAKFVKEEQVHWKAVRKEIQKLCTDALDKMKSNNGRFREYQKYVEDEDKLKIKRLHERNRHLQSVVPEFVTWYYKNNDLARVQNLLSSARAIDHVVMQRTLIRLQVEMHKFLQMNTSEAFCLFSELKRVLSSDTYEAKIKASLEQLKAKAPTCVRLQLWPEGDENQQQLRLVNKFYDSPLCVQRQKIICSSSEDDRELVCSATVDPAAQVLTGICFSSGDAPLTLDAWTPRGTAAVALAGTRWRLTAVDDDFVKICTDDGQFLMAEGSLQDDKSKRFVCLKRENSTDMQLWKLEPSIKKIKIEMV